MVSSMRRTLGTLAVIASLTLTGSAVASADTAMTGLNVPQLGTAKTYAILTSTRIEVIGGLNTDSNNQGNDIGISTSFDLIGWDDHSIVGWTHFNDAAARKAQDDLTKTYIKASVLPAKVIDSHLGGKTIKPGVYVSKTGLFWITGTLTLDTLGDPSARFVFRTTGSISTSPNSKVVIKGGGRACNVFWRIPGMVTLGQGSTIYGHVMSNTYINSHPDVKVHGQLLVRKGGVSVTNNYIRNQVCR